MDLRTLRPMNIEKNIPIPNPKTIHHPDSAASILKAMQVGDSVVVPRKKASVFHSAAHWIGAKVATRKISETEIRVWRMA